ncbi:MULTISPECIES: SusD/RagB family nutrient-binding outer membrane lipoprotein [Flammeovirga]|uniref:SusD/RagB family nutrient-binding outer membrane lipoprotein n=1 Tax=Flammeovirga agarivorans TaxID=2726742 RepID=A0A7X8SGJ2_9BACT|nr:MULTISPECIES: SusD/RagB family nutrient-binding outer membrane lipoprotein [Flammeovirga]NLR89697.1 SusD/RagB family nutrient-binding outer membrane lipoprotein [Flammeovirga agarivorans]
MKKINSIYKITPILFSLLFTVIIGCDNILDINKDPFAAGDDQVAEQPGLLMTTVMTSVSSDKVMETNLFNRWAQHYVGAGASVFSTADNYSVPTFPQTNTWSTFYVSVLKNASRGEALASEIGEVNTAAQFKIMQAFAFYHLTLMFEDVPFDEALNTNILFPESNDQANVLKGIVNLLDQAMNDIDVSNPEKISDEDLLFKGDLDKWLMFANSIKIKTLMVIAGQDASYASSRLETAFSQSHVEAIEDEVKLDYYEDLTNANQFYKLHYQFAGGQSLFFYASNPFIDLLRGTNDPRIDIFYDRPDGTSDQVPHRGVDPGARSAFTSTSVLSLHYISATSPDYWITAAELKLLRAEAILQGWLTGTTEDANGYYREGIVLNMVHLNTMATVQTSGRGITGAEYENYDSSLPNLQELAPANALKAVYQQGYIETFNRGIDSWTYVRRTNYPEDMPLPEDAAISNHITRLPYSPSEVSANPNSPSQKALDTPMWFMTSN